MVSAFLSRINRQLGLVEKLFVAAVLVYLVIAGAGLSAASKAVAMLAVTGLGAAVAIKHAARLVRRGIWRLRNRLVVSYLFIAVVPILLLLILAETGAYVLSSQVGAYLLNAEMERRMAFFRGAASSLANIPRKERAEAVRRTGFLWRDRFPGLEILVRDDKGEVSRFPEESRITFPPPGHGNVSGIVLKDGTFHVWAHEGEKSEAVIIAPITRTWLSGLVPRLGDITLRGFTQPGAAHAARPMRLHPALPEELAAATPRPPVREPASPADLEIVWGSSVPVMIWDQPKVSEAAVLGMRSRISGPLSVIFSQKGEDGQPLLTGLYVITTIFFIVEAIAAFIGISLTRTITSAVHELYEGTERVKEGDFTHRISIRGDDQLAELSRSFNGMTENLERLLRSEKERQRLQAELEIAREVQSQLHPKLVPNLQSFRLTSICHPARMVSGDYYDYQSVGGSRVAVAIGDVAGKGISAALLMASLQSAMRSQLRHCMEASAAAPNGSVNYGISTARLVSNLNQQLYASTSPEKYATFYFSVYDDSTGSLTYTNAGHLPPILVRDNHASRLDTNGLVVGAFEFAQYQESHLSLQPGDLLAFYTDGITEPENEYGEMFGEERLVELLIKSAHRPDKEIVDELVNTVIEWTSSPELQDDMTLLLARKL